ncbi:MAG: Dabb family protein [Bacteroidota bacterium]
MRTYIPTLLICISFLLITSCSNTQMESEITALKAELEETQAKLAEAENRQAEFIHTVFFWLKEGVTEEDKTTFMEGLESLRNIDGVKRSWVGPAAQTPREVVDNSYDMALVLHFANAEDQDAYQVAPVHLAFIDKSAHVWTRVQVYDTLGE